MTLLADLPQHSLSRHSWPKSAARTFVSTQAFHHTTCSVRAGPGGVSLLPLIPGALSDKENTQRTHTEICQNRKHTCRTKLWNLKTN